MYEHVNVYVHGCAMLLCLVICLIFLASSFLPSVPLLKFIGVCTYMDIIYAYMCIIYVYMHVHVHLVYLCICTEAV